MNIKEIQDNAPIQDEKLHYSTSSNGCIVYYLPDPEMPWDAVWDTRYDKWVMYEGLFGENRISSNRKIKPVWGWELVE